ncbi:MAG: hemolysin family protein [Chloroflexota bacterium]
MGNISIIHIGLFLVSLLLAGFFCSAETAFIGLQKLRLKHLVRLGHPNAERVARIIEHPEKFLATVLLGINFFETAMAALGTVMAVSLWGENIGAAAATIVITILTLVFAEVIPKNLAARFGERIALRLVPFIEISTLMLYPVVWVLSHIGLGFQRLGGAPRKTKPTFSAEEMRTAITVGEAEGVIEEDLAEMLHQVFRFSNRPVREIMTPHTETVWVEKGTTLARFLEIYSQHPHTRFPVFEENTDNVVGILSVKDVLIALSGKACDQDEVIDRLIRPAYFTPFNKPLGELLTEMREHNHHIALIVTEYGGISGIVTIEQIIEEIVGDIGDELVRKDEDFVAVDEATYRVDGTLRLEEANEKLRLDLPAGDYDTIAGFVLSHLGHIPRLGEQIKYKNLRIVVSQMKGVKVEEVTITREKDAAAPGQIQQTRPS